MAASTSVTRAVAGPKLQLQAAGRALRSSVCTAGRLPRRCRQPIEPQSFLSVRTSDSRDELRDELETLRPPALPATQTVLLEGFGWDSWHRNGWWRQMRSQIPQFVKAGVTHVWLPPPSASVSAEGYLPGQLFDLNSKYGSAQDLRELCADLLQAGIRPVADIVINHRCADAQDGSGTWNIYQDRVPHPGKSIAWGRWAIAGNDSAFCGEGAPDTGADYGPAPDLDHTNPEVRDSLVDWLNWLKMTVGFEGWRFDYVRGYAPRFTAEYVERSIGNEAFSVGEWFIDLRWNNSFLEYNQDVARSQFKDWLGQAKHCCLFDFITKGQLQEAVKHHEYDRLRDSQGRASGMIGWSPAKSVTFIDNHDTGSTQQHWPFPRAFLGLGHAYILTHPGIPCILHEHLMEADLGARIAELAALRRRAGIAADSRLDILAADHDMYVACVTGSSGAVTLKLGPRFDMGALLPRKEEGWRLVQAGNEYAVWEQQGR